MKEKFIDKDHREIKALSLKWWNAVPETKEERLEYAILQYRCKDYEAAVEILQPLAEEQYTDAYYLYAECLFYHSGQETDRSIAEQYFRLFLDSTKGNEDAEILYERGMCYAYGLGTERNGSLAVELFFQSQKDVPASTYELGCAYMDGRLGLKQDGEKAKEYLREAYHRYAEQAIFALYDAYDRNYKEFPYQRELTEAYSYQLGKYMRVTHVHPSKMAYQNLADLYLNGFPGDTGEDDARFKRKADLYLSKIKD